MRRVIGTARADSTPGRGYDGRVATVIGLLHPGAMGAAVGATLHANGHDVVWASTGRSPATAERAAAAGLRDIGTAAAMADACDVVLSICPPHAARDVAAEMHGFGGIYVDANAISPATAREIGAAVSGAGVTFADGGIVGPPPHAAGTTRLYLSGQGAADVALLFGGTALAGVVVSDRPGDASAVKMAYAAWTKGSAALLLAARAVARAEGVEDDLVREWRLSLPELEEEHARAARSAAAKGWRWIGEMEEIAATFAAAGQPDGFHRAAAEVFRERGVREPGR
jgi:3-hydroxyisobutyrate dehydrogenase-like beta-hydroxyacid dehydrogenase